jgi:MFS transporter, PPP family, 3-phenylpropionic acid transporter
VTALPGSPEARPPRFSAAARARLVYIALYVAVGAAAPYLVLYYRSIGFDLETIGLIVSYGSLISLVAGPAWGLLSDRRGGSPIILAAAAACAIAGALALSQAQDLLGVFAAVVLIGSGFAGLSPIIDARALEASGPQRSGYGPLRAWGSISYIGGSFGTGAAVDAWGIGAAFVVLAIALAVTGLVGLTLRPRPRALAAEADPDQPPSVTPSPRAAVRLARTPPLGLFLLGAWLTYTGLSALMSFYSLRFNDLGAPATMIGIASALGAAAEVPVMLRFPWLAERFGGDRLVVVGAGIFVVRAIVAAWTTEPWVLVVLAGIGGVGYACFLIGGITYVSRHAPPELAATAQSLFSGTAQGFGQVIAGYSGGVIAGLAGIPGLFSAAAITGIAATGMLFLATREPAGSPPVVA